MKKLEFETSKGRFLISEYENTFHFDMMCKSLWNAKLSEITEEKASEIVDINRLVGGKLAYKDYLSFRYLYKAVDSLYSLFDSKDIHLFKNPYLDFETLDINAIEAEEKTFYNPYIFKL